MTIIDVAVRHDGKTKRLVANDTNAALFDKDGSATHLSVTEPGAGRRLPKMLNQDEESVTVSRVAKPCSCIGGVWKTRLSELAAQL